MDISDLIKWYQQRYPDIGEIDNAPNQESFRALELLVANILVPLSYELGVPKLTYGFTSSEILRYLRKHHPRHMAPELDQHAAHEVGVSGKRICKRDGAACDIVFPDRCMREVAALVADNLPFDRMYFYGNKRPVHISYGPEHSRQIVLLSEIRGRRMPRVIDAKTLKGLPC
ncbi:hypothetical protein [Ferrimonas balearica]|uniref:hypothetical protein n=1 Tax=Ferrimonas balearica TaxID=44012 RepID=UPI001C93BB02|nr:hypothetical protein [Ferrimonas balearica]MBY5980544.1 hypothetical protein [Ferrimonas balearica]